MRDILNDSALEDGLPKILLAGTTPNGLFGAKVFWTDLWQLGMRVGGNWDDSQHPTPYELLRSLPELPSRAAASELLRRRSSNLPTVATAYASLRSWMPDLRFIWLQRKNTVARAVSQFRARQTGLWHQSVSDDGTVVPREQVYDFDFAEIHHWYCLGSFQEECWQRFFMEHGISPHSVIYEDLVADYESTVRRLLGFLGVNGEQALIPPPRIRKQSDAISEEWEERYRKLSAEAGI